jgi:hydroxymethylpyrimidine pyrophosphatase-like HAD family hydrolase
MVGPAGHGGGPMRTLDAARVVATDLDGTLLRSDGTISDRSVRALKRACAAGARVVLVTARPPRTVHAVTSAADWTDGLAICSNGAIIYDLARRTVEHAVTVAPAAAEQSVRVLTARMPEIVWSVETGLELVRGPGWSSRFSHDLAQTSQVNDLAELWLHPAVKLLARSGSRSADDMLDVARGVALDGVEVTHSGGAGMIEICAAGVSKAEPWQTCATDGGWLRRRWPHSATCPMTCPC